MFNIRIRNDRFPYVISKYTILEQIEAIGNESGSKITNFFVPIKILATRIKKKVIDTQNGVLVYSGHFDANLFSDKVNDQSQRGESSDKRTCRNAG